MHPDLERIVSADEEARSRVALAERRLDAELAAARAEREASIAARHKAARDALDRELRTIREDGDARVAQLQRQQAAYLMTLAEAGQRKVEDAVASYLRIVCEVSS